ncbi:MAG TPA: aldo/keto reductase [Solirubrobacteraceae bacterium]|jgi:diketogulonate reductase-like aldo/keto reductase
MNTLTNPIPEIELRDGERIPQLGFGVFLVPPEETERAVALALGAGYRHIDTAAGYRNEAEVGKAIRASGIERSSIFVTTKCPNDAHGYEQAKSACHASLEALDLGPIDLYLIHWPVPSQDLYVETWRAFIDLQAEGLVRSIGVSNFQPAHLDRLLAETDVTPTINQIELHPWLQQAELRRKHAELGIVTEAWSPLARGRALDHPLLAAIGERYDRTPAQVVLRWHLQLGNVVIPKSVTAERISENLDVFGFQLDADEVAAIGDLDRGERIGPDPDTFVRP